MPKFATNYQNTIIYQLKCNDDNISQIYVGHTTNFLKRRQLHKQTCNNNIYKGYNTKKYITIRENGGWNNWKMLEICKFPCNDKREAEKKEEEIRMELKANLNTTRCWSNNLCEIEGCGSKKQNNDLCFKHGAVRTKCSIEECQNIIQNNGVCIKHGAVRTKCSIEDCQNKIQNNGVCIKHGAKKYLCSVDGCENGLINNGLCLKHGAKKKLCSVDGCENGRTKDGLCRKHNSNKVKI